MPTTKSHYLALLRKKNQQIAERDRRIAQLEAERRVLLDKFCSLDFGEDMAEENSNNNCETAGTRGTCGTAAPGCGGEVAVRLGRPRPSQIMRRMDRIMEARWQQKLHPAKDHVVEEFNIAHQDAVKKAMARADPSQQKTLKRGVPVTAPTHDDIAPT